MKRAKWIVLAILVLIVIALTVVMIRLDGIVRYAVETQSTASLGLTTELASAHVSILAGKLSLTGYEVYSPKGFVASPMLGLGGASVGVSVRHLRNDPIVVDKVVIDKPRLVIEQANGKLNIMALSEATSTKPADNSAPLQLIIGKLAVNNAEVVIRPGIRELDQEIALAIPSFSVKEIGTGKGNKNGAAIKEVVVLVVSELAKKASESDRLPPDVRQLLSLNADQIQKQVENRIDQEIGKARDKIGEEAGKAIEKGIGDLLGGKPKDEKRNLDRG